MSINPFIIGIISGIVIILAYLINNKLENKDTKSSDILKISILGFCLGVMNAFLAVFASETNITIDQDILTGTPNF
uniref:Uncharacterized protein n=1 Tax=viral metagenome TaxID=1070528 RepID=A0A6C0JC25_9ZZZZ